MTEPKLNYVRCQWCEGNAGAPSHQCTEEGKRAAEEYAAKELALMLKAAELEKRVASITGRQSVKTTNSQLKKLLMECEAALTATEELAESERARAEAAEQALTRWRDWTRRQYGPNAADLADGFIVDVEEGVFDG